MLTNTLEVFKMLFKQISNFFFQNYSKLDGGGGTFRWGGARSIFGRMGGAPPTIPGHCGKPCYAIIGISW